MANGDIDTACAKSSPRGGCTQVCKSTRGGARNRGLQNPKDINKVMGFRMRPLSYNGIG